MKELLFDFVREWGGVIGAAVGTLALCKFAVGILRFAIRKIKAHVADVPGMDGRIECATLDGDLLIVSGFVENKRRRPVFVNDAAFYDPQAVGVPKLMRGELVKQLLEHGTRAPFFATADAVDKDVTFFNRLEVRVFGERGKLLLKIPVDPEKVRMAFEEADKPQVLRPQPFRREFPFESRPTPVE